jgi:DNA-binding CsgD family transcriptional regulator
MVDNVYGMSLPRERLTALLADSALTSVELVIAPPGFGKTTLLREYASSDTGAVFIALPEATDLEAFVRSVIAGAVPSALHSIGALFDGKSERSLETRVGDWLVSRLREFDGTLIVDDFHRAGTDGPVARVLVSTIAATYGRIRWIVASRESPAFPMGSWIARGWMGLPITADDLGFTVDEAAALATSLGLKVPDAALDAVIEETLGWPIGVRLALSLLARERAIGQTRVQTRDVLFALLHDEVWGPLDADLRELVAAAALMPAPAIRTLEAAGFADARARMTRAFAKVPFIQPIDDDAFAIHDLFREFVAMKAPRNAVARESAATRIGAALVESGSPADGLRLLIEAGNVEAVIEALGRHAFELLETGGRSTVNAALAFLAEHRLNDSGIVLAIRGALAFADGSASNSTNLFVRALERDAPPAVRSEIRRRLATSYANRAMLNEALETLKPLEDDASISLEDRLEVSAMSTLYIAAVGRRKVTETAAKIASIEERIPDVRPNMQARLLQLLGNASSWISDTEQAERLSLDGALLATDLGMDTVAALAYGTLYSLAARFDDNASRARSFLRSQAAAAERAANTALRVYALRAQYVIAAIGLDTDEARTLEQTLSSLVDANSYSQTLLFRLARSLQYLADGEVPKAEATMRSMPMASITAPERARCEAMLLLLTLLRGKRSEASATLERALLGEAPSDLQGRIDMAHAYAYRGVAYWILDRPAQARRSFEFNSTTLPQRDRILIDAFKALASLPHPLPNSSAIDNLCRTLADADFRAYGELLRRVVTLDANDVELSAAELETLREFERFGGRAVDVAKSLGKSKFTVQNQIQSAIRKLGCSGRAEALAYARQRGWLDRASN